MTPTVFRTDGPDATRALGERLGRACRGGEVFLLEGDLGAGKTCFVQGLARGLDVPADEPVASPTFVLHVEHHGRLRLDHLDLYRLDDAGQTRALGLDELWGDPGAVAAVEWPGVLGEGAPPGAVRLSFAPGAGPDDRVIAMTTA